MRLADRDFLAVRQVSELIRERIPDDDRRRYIAAVPLAIGFVTFCSAWSRQTGLEVALFLLIAAVSFYAYHVIAPEGT